MIAEIISRHPDFGKLEESPVESNSKILAWHSTVQTKNGNALGSGLKPTRDEARRVACAEFIERTFMMNCDSKVAKEWRFDAFPTACGLAVGFDKEKTIVRSLVEGVERWAMTEWIARRRAISEVEVEFSELEESLLLPFSEIRKFRLSVPFDFMGQIRLVHIALILAFTPDGVFPGSNASTELEGLWTHAALEAQRHYLCVKNSENTGVFPYDRVFYFARNRSAAEAQIPKGRSLGWPIPRIEFFKEMELFPGVFVARTIIKGFENWASSPKTQFLY